MRSHDDDPGDAITLAKRVIAATTDRGDVVLDPFCGDAIGCGGGPRTRAQRDRHRCGEARAVANCGPRGPRLPWEGRGPHVVYQTNVERRYQEPPSKLAAVRRA